MPDLTMVINLTREFGFNATADCTESADTRTYAKLIFRGPIVIKGESLNEKLDRIDREYDE